MQATDSLPAMNSNKKMPLKNHQLCLKEDGVGDFDFKKLFTKYLKTVDNQV